MTGAVLRRIRAVGPQPGYVLAVTWIDGPSMLVDLSESVRLGGVFAPLSDERKFAKP